MYLGKFTEVAHRPVTVPDSQEDLKNICRVNKGGEVGTGLGRRGKSLTWRRLKGPLAQQISACPVNPEHIKEVFKCFIPI